MIVSGEYLEGLSLDSHASTLNLGKTTRDDDDHGACCTKAQGDWESSLLARLKVGP